MAKVILHEKNGIVAVTVASPSFKELHKDKTEDEILDMVQAQAVPEGTPANKIRRVQQSQVPSDRTFRNAWVLGVAKIDIDMPKARVIHQSKIDRIYNRESDIIVKVIINKQARGEDVTAEQAQLVGLDIARANVGPNINAAGTPAILKAVWPVGLPTG